MHVSAGLNRVPETGLNHWNGNPHLKNPWDHSLLLKVEPVSSSHPQCKSDSMDIIIAIMDRYFEQISDHHQSHTGDIKGARSEPPVAV